MKLVVRWAAWIGATFLASFTPSLALGLAAWEAAIVGAVAAILPALQQALLSIAATGTVPPPPTDGET